MQDKHCKSCGKTKPLTDFTSQKKGTTSYRNTGQGVHQYCRECNAERAREWRKKNPNYRGSGKLTAYPKEDRLLISAISSRISQAKGNSRGKDLPDANLTVEYLYDLFKKQDGRCALSNIKMQIQKEHLATLSLDKIIPEKGYTQGNVHWTAWAVNRAKGEMTLEDFIAMCRCVVQYQKEQRLSKGTEK